MSYKKGDTAFVKHSWTLADGDKTQGGEELVEVEITNVLYEVKPTDPNLTLSSPVEERHLHQK